MIRIAPIIDYVPACPRDHTSMPGGRLTIVGSRSLLNVSCPACHADYFADLPVGFAVHSPTILDKSTGEIFGDSLAPWFHEQLRVAWTQKQNRSSVVPTAHVFKPHPRIVILNCLDNLYGHVLLKLLNTQRHLRDPDLGCCVLVPAQLAHLVPPGVSEIWQVDEPMRNGCGWHEQMSDWISEQITGRAEVFLSRAYSHPRVEDYDLKYLRQIAGESAEQITEPGPKVLFSYREDRPWGPTVEDQGKRLQKLYEILSGIFPNLTFILVGFGRKFNLEPCGGKIIDARADGFSLTTDKQWLGLMAQADCAVGVHGSNMLLPSGLSRTSLIFVPRSRYGNSVQDMLFDAKNHDPRIAALTHRMLYGNDDLTDIAPRLVAELICTQVSYTRSNEFLFNIDPKANPVARFAQIAGQNAFREATAALSVKPSNGSNKVMQRIRRKLGRMIKR